MASHTLAPFPPELLAAKKQICEQATKPITADELPAKGDIRRCKLISMGLITLQEVSGQWSFVRGNRRAGRFR
jgi:hypothetical protein